MKWSVLEFLDCTTLTFGLVIGLATLYLFKSRRPKGFPPGPTGLPIVGYIPFLGENAAEKFRKMKKKYGPVMSIQMGTEDWVILNDYDAINEAIVKQGHAFSGRVSNELFDAFTEKCGIGSLDYGPIWKHQRKFGLMTLRGFGVGKKGMEENIMEEIPYLMDLLTSNGGLSLRRKLTVAVSNIICRVTFGSRFAYDDEKFTNLIDVIEKLGGDNPNNRMLGFLSFAPVLRHLPYFKGIFEETVSEFKAYVEILKGITKEHETTYNEDDLRDFIDAYLKEMKEEGAEERGYHFKQLCHYIRDLFEAGTVTTSSTLYWCILCFAHQPRTLEKISREIEEVIGDAGVPSMKHREQMPYTRAFIQEIMRHRVLVPLGVPHKTNENAVLNGYNIPKECAVIMNIWAVHFDPNLFENPTEFRPERFLDSDGKFLKSNHVIPFSVGPRHCLGEQLAQMEIFTFLTSIVQKLRIAPDPGKPLPSFDKKDFNMLIFEAPEYEVTFEKR